MTRIRHGTGPPAVDGGIVVHSALQALRIDNDTMVVRGIERVRLADGVAGMVQEWEVQVVTVVPRLE